MEVSKRLEGVGEYYFSTKLREIDALNKTGDQVINLGIGSPDLPPHSLVIKKLSEEASKSNTHAYQNYKGSPALRNAFSKWYEKWYQVILDPDSEVLPLIGSKEGIMHICMTYIDPGDKVLIPNPGYPTYRSAATIAGATLIEYNLKENNGWFPDFSEIEKNDLTGTKLMFVNYPHMPTGRLPTETVFEKLVAFAKKHDILLVHDNPYSFILNDNPASLLAVQGAKEVAIELNSLSKSHNMAGWRLGVLCGAKERVNEVLRFKSNMDSGMFLPVQLAAAEALSLGQDWFKELNSVYQTRRNKVFKLLDILKCNYDTSQAGMFVWASIPSEFETGYGLSDEVLTNSRVFLTPGGIFGSEGQKYIRVSLCTPEVKIEEAISRISK
jgi:LL-diaminopimelate aminotransferase